MTCIHKLVADVTVVAGIAGMEEVDGGAHGGTVPAAARARPTISP